MDEKEIKVIGVRVSQYYTKKRCKAGRRIVLGKAEPYRGWQLLLIMESNSEEALREVLKKKYTAQGSRPRIYNKVWFRRIIVFTVIIILVYILYILTTPR